MSELPTAWVWTTVAELANVGTGTTPSRGNAAYWVGGSIPWISSAAVNQPIVTQAEEFITDAALKETTLRLYPKHTLILALYGEGKTRGKVSELLIDATINQALAALQTSGITAECRPFLKAFLLSNYVVMRRQAAGGVQPNLNLSIVKRIRVPFAPLNEQYRIVSKTDELLSDLDAGVAALERAKANLKRYRAAVLKAAVEGRLTEQWRAAHPATEPAPQLLERILAERRQKWQADQLAKFAAAGKTPPKNWQAKYVEPTAPETIGLPELPKDWCWVSLDSVCCLIADIDHNMPKSVEVGVKFLSAKDLLDDGTLNFTNDVKLISEGDYLRLSRKVSPQRNDIIYSRIGARLGKSRLVETDERFLVSYSCCTIRSLVVRPRFLARYLDCEFVLRRALSSTQSIGVPDLGLDKIKQFAVPLCSSEEQDAIITEMEQKLSVIAAAETEIDHGLVRAARLRQSILKRAFEGKLVPQDANDEPASVLLDRIRAAQREEQKPSLNRGRSRRTDRMR